MHDWCEVDPVITDQEKGWVNQALATGALAGAYAWTKPDTIGWGLFAMGAGLMNLVLTIAGDGDDFVGALRFPGCFFLPTGPMWLDLVDQNLGPNGGMQVEQSVDLTRTTCQPFYVGIIGETNPKEWQTCTWTAVVANPLGSIPPYTYEWKWNGEVVGTGDSYTGFTGSEGWNILELTAWDALGSESTFAEEVIVESFMGYYC